jgi:hypothetical protein
MAYKDSSNLYAFAAGDPVNGRDPTGLAAGVSNSGVIIGKRPNGRSYRFGAGYGKQSIQQRIEVQLMLESDSDLKEADVRRIMARAGLQYGPTSFGCAPGETCLKSAAPARGGDYALGSGLRVANTVNAALGPVNQVNGEAPFPTPDPANDRQRAAYERTGDLMEVASVAAGAAGVAGRLSAWAQSGETVIVYRVEGTPNTRVIINPDGTVAIVGNDKSMLWLNFGSRARAEQFFAQKFGQSMPGLQMKSFEVPRSFLNEMRALAVDQGEAATYPGAPQIGDPTKAPDQFGLRQINIERLRGTIIQGSGQVHK